MRTEHWVIMLSAFVLCLFCMYFWHMELEDTQTDNDIKAEYVLEEAVKTAMGAAELEKMNVFSTTSVRKKAINEFRFAFDEGFNKGGISSYDFYYLVPCVILIDNDGFYVNYSKQMGSEMVRTTSELQTWTKECNGMLVRFYLSDYVQVTDMSSGETQAGSINQIEFGLTFEEGSFEKEREKVILDSVEKTVNEYILTHNRYANRDERDYHFYIPRNTDATVNDTTEIARVLTRPSVIAFYQGPQSSNGQGYINSYAFTGAIYEDDIICMLSNDTSEVGSEYAGTYHKIDCPFISGEVTKRTMRDCVKSNTAPCPHCMYKF